MIDLLALETADCFLAVLPPLITGLLGAIGGVAVERRRNGRRNNPGANADDNRYAGKGGSDCKAGLGPVCREHNDGISANRAAIAAVGADMETYWEQVTLIFEQLREIQRDVTTLLERVGD